MGSLRNVINLLKKVGLPLKANASFFFFMYLIGIIASYIELPSNDPDASVYGNLWLELFLDLYILCNRLHYDHCRCLLLGEIPVHAQSVHAPFSRRNRW